MAANIPPNTPPAPPPGIPPRPDPPRVRAWIYAVIAIALVVLVIAVVRSDGPKRASGPERPAAGAPVTAPPASTRTDTAHTTTPDSSLNNVRRPAIGTEKTP